MSQSRLLSLNLFMIKNIFELIMYINKIIIIIISLISFSLITGSTINDKAQSFNFEFEFQVTEKEMIELTCVQGCAWKELSFECPDNQCDVNVDNLGMNTNNERDNRDFIINIQYKNSVLNLKCEAGCAWKSLTLRGIEPGSTKAIDNYGDATSR